MQLSIRNLSFMYDGSYTPVFENLNINLDTRWRLGLVGRNGRGKTTLLSLILGKYAFRALKDYDEQRKQGKVPVFKAKNINLPHDVDCWK